MMDFLKENVNYPQIAKEQGIQGRVILNFVVETDGSLDEITIVRGVDPLLDQEAINVINKMPNWKPGTQRGQAVRVRFTLPIVFRLPAKGQVQDEVVINYKEDNSKENQQEELFIVVENQPEFPGGTEAMLEFLKENVQYPPIAKENGIQGRVITNFVVEKDGRLSDVQVMRGVDPSLDAEAVRVIQAMPSWKPGTQRGQAVRVRFTLPIVFRLPDAKTDNVPPPPPPPPATIDTGIGHFPGGSEAMFKYMGESIRYPVVALENRKQGLVTAVCNVDTKGNVKVVRFNKSADPLLNNEAKRVLENMPQWTPSQAGDELVETLFVQSFLFRLQGDNPGDHPAAYKGDVPENVVVVVGYAPKA